MEKERNKPAPSNLENAPTNILEHQLEGAEATGKLAGINAKMTPSDNQREHRLGYWEAPDHRGVHRLLSHGTLWPQPWALH